MIGNRNSGKSDLAEALAIKTGDLRRYYLATMKIYDEEGKKRVARHRMQRAGKGFLTIEKEYGILDALEKMEDPMQSTVLLECMSNLVGNEMFENKKRSFVSGADEPDWMGFADEVTLEIMQLADRVHNLIIVSNAYDENGEGYDDETRLYVKLLHTVNERLLGFADRIYDLREGRKS
ncbi:MAG: bifunctional adenosylcobinamide kinase/adenosylcobinamide-phosphate guanylyltransferase [Lachnospiraceae bacterium]|nr:bifunctional adenosylcobinamide kinase/adenosylcobinamide-phosphate guanylyltransferase [Lachnospiraceae bacterium]